ncbi:restriction endonuclease subunit S [Aliivibrio sp. S4TY2]|uniref:restriction endonuclease subunit S n=1 Tax=unclassified Aliivibrio TaxID=2645654 RepID=UPI0023788843|nr:MULTISPECIES: restriction endonuclease subunit S [unclassified Aliivibrio]MDD9155844.1 restriction endonuclease subunit S [Aliivibrio sp. S4TY2]MDD9159476.1 restriction endonuclease subunit S [Aliivibrio sp. S4TY1]MDD9163552.1 restriction endonuclease subunit S [Aliivibrio sp. S4MY2]MDD9167553.1 restriction endonuclease subunit S [Aliivibrio sp. S4MY4]MDD9186077.1 restriction endonuclease subunit S [Aliivibrio sp. S4MY3]
MKTVLTPSLRFKDDNESDYSSWVISNVGMHTEQLNGYAFKSHDISESSEGYKLMRGINITEGRIRHSVKIDRFYNGSVSKIEKYFLQENDLVIGMDGSKVGKNVALINAEDSGSLLVQRVARLRPKKGTSIKYIYQHITSAKFQRYVDIVNTSSAIPHISKKQIDDYKLSYPSFEEQTKIASFLTSVDSRISQLTEKHRLLKEYKKGVMQQIFSQQLRFKDEDGRVFPEWEVFRLADIAKPIKRKAKVVIENVMTISAGKGFLHQKERFSQVIAGTSLDKYTHLKKGEFAYNRGNSKSYTYGCIYLLNDSEALVPFVYRSFGLEKGVPDFYEQLFGLKYLDRQLRRLISSSARMDGLLNIGEKDFYQVTVPFPHEAEQQKIAQFLQSIDKKIDAVTQQVEQTKQFKKGLLQQMFV